METYSFSGEEDLDRQAGRHGFGRISGCMKKAIVTGATGFIGSWLVQELLDHQVEVTVVVRDPRRLLNDYRKNERVVVIQSNLANVTEADFSERNYDAFFHFGWAGVAPEEKNNIDLQLENIAMSLHVLQVAKAIGCRKFIASGTVAEYVYCDKVMNLEAKQSPSDIYGAAKVSAHYFMEVRAKQLEQPFIWVVIPSTFGERRKDNNIISYTIKTLLKGQKPHYGNLEQMWDFLYVSEVARAVYLIGEKGRTGKTYGIGSGVHQPLRTYIEKIRDAINPALPLGIGDLPEMSQKTFSSCVNISDLQKDTGFIPKVSFEEGIQKTIQYFQNGSKSEEKI